MLIGAQMMGAGRGGCVLDALPEGAAAAPYGFERLKASHVRPCINVRRASDNTFTDVGFVGNELDINTLLNFAGGGSAYIYKQYCLDPVIGAAGDLINANAAGQPCIVNNGVLVTDGAGRPAMDLTLNTGPVLLNIPAAVCPSGAGPFAINFVGSWKTNSGLGMYWLGSSGAGNFLQCYIQGVSPYKISPSTGTLTSLAGGATSANTPFISTVKFGSTVYDYLDGVLVASGSGALTVAPGGGHLGYLQGSNPWTGKISRFIIFPSDLSDASRQTLEHQEEAYYGISGS